jgi:hypothetical protein
VSYDDTVSSPRFVITWTSGLSVGRYRLVLSSDPRTPIVDARMRPLRPHTFVRHLRLDTDTTTGLLTLASTLF